MKETPYKIAIYTEQNILKLGLQMGFSYLSIYRSRKSYQIKERGMNYGMQKQF